MRDSSRIADQRGLTALELIISIGVLAALGLVLLGLLRASIFSSARSAEEAFLLSAARKALGGTGGFNGIVWDLRKAADVGALEPNTLVLGTAEGSRLTYGLSSGGDLLCTRLEAGEPKAETKAKGLSSLSLRYYGRGSDYRVVESTYAAAASLATLSFDVPAKARTLRLFSGARLMNHP